MFQIAQIPIVRRPPTFLKASSAGVLTLTANGTPGAIFQVPGVSVRQDRLQVIVTNLDAALTVKVQNLAGTNLLTVFPQSNITLETEADIQVFNPNGSSVNVEVCEIYVDAGRAPAGSLAVAGVPGAGGSGGGAAGGGSSGGGGGSFGGSGGGGGTHLP